VRRAARRGSQNVVISDYDYLYTTTVVEVVDVTCSDNSRRNAWQVQLRKRTYGAASPYDCTTGRSDMVFRYLPDMANVYQTYAGPSAARTCAPTTHRDPDGPCA
jgi:hypothetical protein